MKNAIKIAFAVAVATVGIAACSSTPVAKQNTASTTPESLPTPSSSAVVTEVTTVTVTNPPKPDSFVQVDGRLGYGDLKLGMTLEEARAAGLTDLTWDSAGDGVCVSNKKMAISKKYGVVRITLPGDAQTSKGIGVGSTFADVKKAYSNVTEYRNGLLSKIDSNARYSFIGVDKVDEIRLGSNNADCVVMYL